MNKNDIEITVSTMEDIANTSFPSWDELPEFELYMDQVIAIVNRYMGNMADLMHDEKIITQAMINNYVKAYPSPCKEEIFKDSHRSSANHMLVQTEYEYILNNGIP